VPERLPPWLSRGGSGSRSALSGTASVFRGQRRAQASVLLKRGDFQARQQRRPAAVPDRSCLFAQAHAGFFDARRPREQDGEQFRAERRARRRVSPARISSRL